MKSGIYLLLIFFSFSCGSTKTKESVLVNEIILESENIIKENKLHHKFFKFYHRKQILEAILNNAEIMSKKDYLLQEIIISNDFQYQYIIYDLIDKTKMIFIYRPSEENPKVAKVILSNTTRIDTTKYDFDDSEKEISKYMKMNEEEYLDILINESNEELIKRGQQDNKFSQNSICLTKIQNRKLIWVKVFKEF